MRFSTDSRSLNQFKFDGFKSRSGLQSLLRGGYLDQSNEPHAKWHPQF